VTPDQAAAEAAQILAEIRERTARADWLLIYLKDSGTSWAEIARLIDPTNPPTRSTAQRRVESARRRLTEQAVKDEA
jgi:hypothetical protein